MYAGPRKSEMHLNGMAVISGVICTDRLTIKLPPHQPIESTSSTQHAIIELVPLWPGEIPDELFAQGVQEKKIQYFVESGSWARLRSSRGMGKLTCAFLYGESQHAESPDVSTFFLLEALRFFCGTYANCTVNLRSLESEVLNISINMTSQRSTTVEDFVLTKKGLSDLSRFITFWLKAHQIIRTSTDLKIANRYIERALTSRVRDEDKILFLTIALEALVSPNDRNELKNRNARAAALLAGINSDDRAKINKFIMECYDIRSKVAHGTFDSFRERDLKKIKHIKFRRSSE